MAAKYTDTITTDAGTVLEGATVELLTGAGALVTTYTDDALTQNAATSRTADANGLVELYVADGTYSVRTTYNGVVKMLANVELYDISTIASTSSGAVANKAQASAVGISGSAENMGPYTSPSLTDNQTAKQNIEELGAAADARPTSATLAGTGGAALIGTANFSGVTIPDGSNGQQALQALETELERKNSALGIAIGASNMGTYTGTTIPDNETAKQNIQSLETELETKAPSAFSHSTSYAAGTVGAKLKQSRAVTDAAFNADSTGVSDAKAAFESAGALARTVQVPAGTYNLSADPNPAADVTWFVDAGVSFTGTGLLPYVTDKVVALGGTGRSIESSASFYTGIFGYLEQNAAISGYGTIGVHGSARSSGGAGGAGEADIGVAAFAVHDLAASAGGVWGLYSTVVRQSGVNGATHGLEIDVANFGSTVLALPHAPNPSGVTEGARICTGGETTAAGSSPGTASVALAIIRNDSQGTPTAKFDKGILFHNVAIDGADGTGGSAIGTAIAFGIGHAMRWYNNSGDVVAEIVTSGTVQASMNWQLDFNTTGVTFQDRSNGKDAFVITKGASAVNGVQINPSPTGVAPAILAIGDDTNIDLQLAPKGTGVVKFGSHTATGDTAINGYITIKDAAGNTVKLATVA